MGNVYTTLLRHIRLLIPNIISGGQVRKSYRTSVWTSALMEVRPFRKLLHAISSRDTPSKNP